MLNEKICFKCFSEVVQKMQLMMKTDMAELQDNFKRFWQYKKCHCLPQAYALNSEFKGSLIPITSKPPKECPYVLEQTLTQDQETSVEPPNQ